MADDKRTKIGTGAVAVASPTPAPATPSPSSVTELLPAPANPPPAQHQTSYLPPAPPLVDPLLGQVLAGRYLIQKKLGEGGMGAVYLATHQVLEKQVALKVLHSEFSRKADLVERFMQEAKAASRIRHENVIDISDFGATPEGLVFFAMELLQGHDLHEDIARARLAGQLLPYSRSKKIFLQICAALSAAHARGIIHRDLKPENVYLVEFLGDPDFVKLLDFGIAKLTEVNEEGRKLTKTGMLFGTPEYMSPEQARGERVDHRVDIYAMGCILFQLLTGRVPFEADNFMGVLSLHLTEQPPVIPPAVFERIGAPPELGAIIDQALAKNPADRWQTIDDLANAVRRASGEAPIDRSTGMQPMGLRAASVPAPAVTKEARTPTPAPLAAHGTPPPIAPATQPAVDARQRTQWTGNLQVPEMPAEGPRPRSKLPLIVGGVVVAAIAVVAVVLATRGGKQKPDEPAAPSGSNPIAVATPDAPPAPPPPPKLPEWSDVKLLSVPAGAEVIDLEKNRKLGKTPLPLQVPGSNTPRQFQFVLKGYSDAIIELTPNRDTIEYTMKLEKGIAGKPTIVRPGPGSSATTTVVTPDAGAGSAVKAPEPPPKPDAGVAAPLPDDCPELPCGIKDDPSRKKCKSNDDCGGGECANNVCKQP